MKTKRKKIIPMLTAVVIVLSSCSIFGSSDEPKEVFSEEKAGEVAVAYLNEKYGDEFVVVSEMNDERDSIIGGTTWYCADVIRKSDEDKEEPRKYEVSVSWDTSYTILGDTVMFEYYHDIYTDYAVPIIENELGDIPFRLIVYRMTYNDYYVSKYGFLPNTGIPENVYDKNGDFITGDLIFDLLIPESSLENISVDELCDRIKTDLNSDSFDYAYLLTVSDQQFNEIAEIDNKDLNYRKDYNYIKLYEM